MMGWGIYRERSKEERMGSWKGLRSTGASAMEGTRSSVPYFVVCWNSLGSELLAVGTPRCVELNDDDDGSLLS
ncbi:hypothetical protein FF1_035271 [Malus domestica]